MNPATRADSPGMDIVMKVIMVDNKAVATGTRVTMEANPAVDMVTKETMADSKVVAGASQAIMVHRAVATQTRATMVVKVNSATGTRAGNLVVDMVTKAILVDNKVVEWANQVTTAVLQVDVAVA